MKFATRTAALSVAALIGVAGLPTVAAAAPGPEHAAAAPAAGNEHMYSDDPNSGARVTFTRDGDVVELCDIQADGYKAFVDVVDWTTDTFKYRYEIGGDGRCQTFRASLGGKYNLAEDHVFRFRVALTKGGSTLYWPDTAYWEN